MEQCNPTHQTPVPTPPHALLIYPFTAQHPLGCVYSKSPAGLCATLHDSFIVWETGTQTTGKQPMLVLASLLCPSVTQPGWSDRRLLIKDGQEPNTVPVEASLHQLPAPDTYNGAQSTLSSSIT